MSLTFADVLKKKEQRAEQADRLEIEWFSLKNNNPARVVFLQELDPDAPNFDSAKGGAVYLVEQREHAEKGHPFYFLNVARSLGLPVADIIEENVVLTPELVQKYSTGIDKINGKPFEGVVVKHSTGSFKIINKHYDSKK